MTMKEDTDIDCFINTGFWCLCRHYAEPLVPSLPGQSQFKGLVLHSHDYRHPEVFTDMNVLCLGAGPSGVDISIEIAPFAKQVQKCHVLLGWVDTNYLQTIVIASFAIWIMFFLVWVDISIEMIPFKQVTCDFSQSRYICRVGHPLASRHVLFICYKYITLHCRCT